MAQLLNLSGPPFFTSGEFLPALTLHFLFYSLHVNDEEALGIFSVV